jgi:molybdopterin synthase catalytic subunit
MGRRRTEVIDNPNEYSDEDYSNGSASVFSGIDRLWQAGATVEQIETTLQDAVQNAIDESLDVKIERSA